MSSIITLPSHMGKDTYTTGKHKTRFKRWRRPRFTHNNNKTLPSQRSESRSLPRTMVVVPPLCSPPLSLQPTAANGGAWRRDSHGLVTLYLWWLFGVCLIFCTDGGNSLLKWSGQHLPTTTTTTTRTRSLLVSASYLEPDEFTQELDRPGKSDLIILIGV